MQLIDLLFGLSYTREFYLVYIFDSDLVWRMQLIII